ncbi:MAG: peptidylprolyl isomerase [Betaproteobacteria bacterium]|nr:peptidylprolyl isomerase [Betaproteobacteria bacterium]
MKLEGAVTRNAHALARWCLLSILGVACVAGAMRARGADAPAEGSAADTVATVGDSVITTREYAMTLRSEVRRRFYHAKPPEAELAKFYREVADRMIERRLALQEARRRGLRTDAKALDGEIRRLREKSGHREKMVDEKQFWSAMRKQLEEDQLVDRLRDSVRTGIDASDGAVRRYYDGHGDKFTEPERARVAAILLKVQASAPQAAWDGAQQEAARILKRLRAGADFGEAAKLHSADASAAKGGELGYLHKGMLGQTVEEVLEKLNPGEISEPVTVLEGVAIFKLVDRKPPHLTAFEQARGRARDLLLKEEEERAWKGLMARLRESTPIRVDERLLTPG